ncbi:hypothetical protein F5B22DRAFT_386375 [Xylaria bambusicola]|uniref:uncharacterized protein n=1 Tax=Xylaria bambusicola TaxID=326684 RepID=UPI0020076D67|nr:uncharacterized protein F5B22DRAFT_386375 [Xylaria bambusicola]KAI0508653.1 hypothetical protein F5B22DRAFT_386375 [Xylaria bambusicola]
MANQQPLFGLLPAGQPLITAPSQQPNQTSFLYLIPSTTPSNPKPFAHLAVFLLPGISLPENTAAAIYIAQNPSAFVPSFAGSVAANFKFLGGVGPGKESAVFKVGTNAGAEGGVVIGIDIEDAGSVAERIQQLQQQSQSQSTALVLASGSSETPSTQVLAQRIIQNAFNFLSGFSGQVGQSGIEVVPLKAFQDWWRKFETKIRNDPSFLERPQD